LPSQTTQSAQKEICGKIWKKMVENGKFSLPLYPSVKVLEIYGQILRQSQRQSG
jgi:hypothetical protein